VLEQKKKESYLTEAKPLSKIFIAIFLEEESLEFNPGH
jgi:hypothetical protein